MAADYPPFAPTLDVEKEQAALVLGGAERRTGHIYRDCPAYEQGVVIKGQLKAPGCKPCIARWQEVGKLARLHQQLFDQAWYALAAQADPPVKEEAPMNIEAEREVWEAVAANDTRTVGRGKSYEYEVARDEPRVDRAEAAMPAPANHRPNKFAGKCVHCAGWVEANAGALGKNGQGKWVVAHLGACPQAKPVAAEAAPDFSKGGVYRNPAGLVVRVQIAKQSKKPYAVNALTGEYLGGGKHLDGLVKLSLDEAKAFGRETGVCCVCSATLTDPVSVEAGIGPICSGRWS